MNDEEREDLLERIDDAISTIRVYRDGDLPERVEERHLDILESDLRESRKRLVNGQPVPGNNSKLITDVWPLDFGGEICGVLTELNRISRTQYKNRR